MAHDRKRHVAELSDKLLAFSPITGIFGHRQVGKSTYITTVSEKYRTLDDVDALSEAHKDPKKFIRTDRHPYAIDECQLEPRLFPTLKEWVRTHKKPGQFILSGSVRFTSRKAIRESLAGRMAYFELLPFSVAELLGEPLSACIPTLLGHKRFTESSLQVLRPKSTHAHMCKGFEKYLTQGGLPGLCFLRENELRARSLAELHSLILDRDLRLVLQTKLSLQKLKEFLAFIGTHSWEPYNASEVRRALGLAPQTQRSLLYAMESVFLIRRIKIQGRKGEVFCLEDQFEEFSLSRFVLPMQRQQETALYRNLRTQMAYRLGQEAEFGYYLTRDHARVPLVISTGQGHLGAIVLSGSKPTRSEQRSADSFLKAFGDSKILFLRPEVCEPTVLNDRSLLCSLFAVL